MRHFAFPLFWAASIYFLCTLGSEDLPSLSFWDFLNFDKLIHALMFAVLVLSLIVCFRKQSQSAFLRKRAIESAFVLSFLYGTTIEILQLVMAQGRSADWKDVVANTVGCILGIYFFRLIYGKLLFKAS